MALNVLRAYAMKNPSDLPKAILFSHNEKSMTIYDGFPKAIFHFLILPRLKSGSDSADLSNLQALLKGDKERAKNVITFLRDDSEMLKKEIKQEMLKMYGFDWDIWVGFHAVPSMTHLHLHVISADLCSVKLKHKKHYNSFHPKLGFFLHVDSVLSWFDAEPSYFQNKAKLEQKPYELLLKEDLTCFHCNDTMKNMPTLKQHLQEEWDFMRSKAVARAERKRKIEANYNIKLEAKKLKIERDDVKKE